MIIGDKRLKNRKEVIQFLKECRDIHKFYFKNPRYCRGNVGSAKFHKTIWLQYKDAMRILKNVKNITYK